MKNIYTEVTKCRICNSSSLTETIALPPQYLSPTFVESNRENELSKIKVPLTLLLCDKNKNPNGCGLLQLKETTNPELLYHNYFYRSSANSTMRKDLAEVVKDVMDHVDLKDDDVVVDIGANDGTMISYYPSNVTRIGIEPAKNISWKNLDRSITMINGFFEASTLQQTLGNKKVKAFTCCAMFYDLDDPNTFVSHVKQTLHDDGVWCIQLSYLPLMLSNMNFYDICHEHLEYYSLHTLKALMERHSLTICDAEKNEVNGGSIRVFITHTGLAKKISKRVERMLQEENEMDLFNPETYRTFYRKIEELKAIVENFVKAKIASGEKVIGLGASTKGNILLQLFGLNKEILPYISEINKAKIGLRTLGTDIELISDEKADEMKPNCKVVLPWYFKEEIVEREQKYMEQGGELLFPMPYAHVVHKNGETRL